MKNVKQIIEILARRAEKLAKEALLRSQLIRPGGRDPLGL
jgi:hypothetical protein